MANQQQGQAIVFGISSATATLPTFTLHSPTNDTTVSGYAKPTVSGLNVSHQVAQETITNEAGEVCAIVGHGEYLEATFDLIPSSGTSMAAALVNGQLPALGSTIVTAGFQVISMGPFADALNVNSGGSAPATSRWIYMGGGSVRLSSEGHATVSLPVKRFPSIVGGQSFTN